MCVCDFFKTWTVRGIERHYAGIDGKPGVIYICDELRDARVDGGMPGGRSIFSSPADVRRYLYAIGWRGSVAFEWEREEV